jgi:hypothetical protein
VIDSRVEETSLSASRYPRSPKLLLGGMAHLGRLIDKIRLHHAGEIQDYNYLTAGFDKYLLELLQLDPRAFEERVLQGGTDEEILAWVRDHARPVSADDLRQWNDRVLHGGPKDDAARERFQARLREAAAHRGVPVERAAHLATWADVIDFEEGRL